MELSPQEFLDLDLLDKNQEALQERVRKLLYDCYLGGKLEVGFVKRRFTLAVESITTKESLRKRLEFIFDEASYAAEIEIESYGGNAGIQQILDEYNS